MSWLLAFFSILQLLILIGLFAYFVRTGSWDEKIKYTILEEEDENDPEVVPNPYRQVWKDYLSSR
jgi:hypothetical protein